MNSETINVQTHRFPVTTFAAATFAESLAHYSFRSGAWFFLMDIGLGYNKESLIEIFTLIPFVISLLGVAGGIISDFFLGSRRAIIIGSVLQCLGYLIMSVSDKTVFILGLGILVIGSGLYSPNIISLLGIVSRKDNKTTVSNVLIQSVATSFASFCAIFSFGFLAYNSWKLVCLFSGITTLIPALLFFFTKNVWFTNTNTANNKLSKNTNNPLPVFRVLILTVGAGFCFALMLYYGSSDFIAQFSDLSHNKNIFRNISFTTAFAYLIIGTLFAIIWNFFKLSPYIKLFLGFVIYGFTLYSFYAVKNLTPDLMLFFTVQLLVVLEVICQLLISPTITALLLDKAPIKILSCCIAIYLCLLHLLERIIVPFKHSLNTIGLSPPHLLMVGLSALLALLSIIHYINKNKKQNLPST